jgi:hypothetical protein
MPKVKISTSGLPVGAYTCTFEGIEETNHADYGFGWKWIFEVIDGPHAGERCYRTTKAAPTVKNSCGRFLAALVGKRPEDGLEVDTNDFIGEEYTVVIEDSPNSDSTRIGTFARMAAAPLPAPTAAARRNAVPLDAAPVAVPADSDAIPF